VKIDNISATEDWLQEQEEEVDVRSEWKFVKVSRLLISYQNLQNLEAQKLRLTAFLT
jgi:hypothetical protein